MKRGILFFILLSVLSASEPAFAKDPALIRSGYKYIDKGFISKAIPTFQQAVEKYPDNYKAHLGLAIATFKQGGNENFKIAKDHFRRALDLQSDNYEAMTKLARLLSWDPNSRSEALHLYRRASAIKPNDMDIKYQLAEVLSWEGNSYESVDLLEQLYKNKPNDNKLALLYANALSGSGRHFDSLGLYKKAIQGKVVFDKNSALNYARALAKTYNTDMAIKIYNDYLNLADEQNEILNAKKELASVLFDSGRYNEAIDIDSTIENKTKDVLLRLARANDKVANTQEAIAIFEETYNIYPDDLEVQRSAAQFLSKIGGYNITASKIFERMIQNGTATLDDKISLAYIYNEKDATKDKAIELFRDILQSPDLDDKKSEEIMLSLARALSSEKNTRPESVQLYRQILAKDSDNTELNFEFVELLSWQDSTRREALIKYFDMLDVYPGNPKVQNGFEETLSWYLPTDADIELYEKILAKYPDNINAVKGLAYLASQYEDKSKAIDLYKKLLSFDPDNVDITYQYANLLASNEDTRKEAIDILEKVYNQKPDNLDVLTTLANNLLYTKKYKKAKDLYDKILNLSPDNKDALIGKARIYGWQGLNLAAYKAYTRVYEMYPYDADVAYEYASIAKKLGKNAKALEILQKIKGHSMLPDVPDMPEIAMAINYQVMSVDHSYSGSPVQSNADLNKIQTDLHDIENSIKELEKQLENLQKVNNELDNKTHTIVNQQNNAQINTTNYTETYQELSDGYKSNTYSPFMLQNESLPEPVMPKTITQTVTYNENDPYLSSPYDYPAVINDKTYDEIVLNSGYEPDPIHFRITGFEDALSGRRYDIMHDFFGDLEKDIMYDMRPEIRTSFMFSNEAGDATADAMEMHGYPSFFSVNVTPQNRFSFGVTSATYGMTTSVHPASITATSYIMGWNSRPHERVNFDAELAINSFSDPQAPVDVTGKAKLELKLHDRLRLKLGYRREPLYQSVFETTGYTIQPQYSRLQLATLMGIESGPLYNPNNAINYQRLLADPNYYDQLRGQFMGQVRDNAVAVEATFIPFNKWDVNAGYEYSAVRGENIEHNGRHQALFSVGRTFTGIPNHLFRLGYQFLFFGYRKDLSAFPNMTSYPYLENGRPIPVTRQMEYNEAFTTANQANNWSIPSDVWNDPTGATVTRRPSLVDFIRAPRGVGIGGYFSPTQFYLNSFRFDFEGKVFNGRLYYKGGASLGVQQIGDRVSRNDLLAARGLENFGTVAPNDPRLRFPAFRANYDAAQSIRDSSDPTSLASAFDFTAFLKITDFLTVYSGVDYLNTGAFDRWRYNGGLILRPAIDSLTPIFRKPKVSPSTTPEDDNQ